MNATQTFPKSVRLHRDRDIRKVFECGVYQSLGPIGVKYLATDIETGRFLISVSKRVGNAPYRNRVKRLLREAIRRERFRLCSGYDICFFVTGTPQRPLDFPYVLRQVRRFFNNLNRNTL